MKSESNHINGLESHKIEICDSDVECLISLIRKTNGYLSTDRSGDAVPFYVDGKVLGLIKPMFLPFLFQYPDVFIMEKANGYNGCPERIVKVSLSKNLNSCESRTAALRTVVRELRQHSTVLVALKGWRDEDYSVYNHFHEGPLFLMERAATSLFGIRRYGVHINGYVRNEESGAIEKMWIAQRALDKPTFPGLMDNMAAGGFTSGYKVIDVAKKELQEEASCPEEYFRNLKSAGMLCYCYEDRRGICPENLFVYDLELPPTFTPLNSDGEVDGFILKTIPEVFKLILQPSFKPNSALVILDFLIRHGFITPEHTSYYNYINYNIHMDPFAHLSHLTKSPALV